MALFKRERRVEWPQQEEKAELEGKTESAYGQTENKITLFERAMPLLIAAALGLSFFSLIERARSKTELKLARLIERVLEKADKNQDGVLQHKEYEALLAALGIKKPASAHSQLTWVGHCFGNYARLNRQKKIYEICLDEAQLERYLAGH